MTDISDPTKLIERLPSPAEVEEIMIQRELETQKALDGRAQMFALYMPRLKGQLNFMSKKQLIKLATHLSKSEHTKDEDINKAMIIASKLNLNAVRKVIGNVIESPLNEHEIKMLSTNEKSFFSALEELLAQKYATYIMNYINNPPTEGQVPRLIQELVTYLPDYLKQKKTLQVEKDSFATANQILLTKTLMIQHTLLEHLNEQEELKNESLGSLEKVNEKNTSGNNGNEGK